MADDADISATRQEIEEKILMRAQSNPHAKEVERNADGTCLYCETPIPEPKRWCNKYCLTDWEKYVKPFMK